MRVHVTQVAIGELLKVENHLKLRYNIAIIVNILRLKQNIHSIISIDHDFEYFSNKVKAHP